MILVKTNDDIGYLTTVTYSPRHTFLCARCVFLLMIQSTELQLKCVGGVSVQQPSRLLWLNPSPIVMFHGSFTVTLQIKHTHRDINRH